MCVYVFVDLCVRECVRVSMYIHVPLKCIHLSVWLRVIAYTFVCVRICVCMRVCACVFV